MQPLPAEDHAARADTVSSPFLRLPSVMRMTGLGRSTIYRMVAAQTFPSPVRLGARAVAWRRADLESWSEARPQVSH